MGYSTDFEGQFHLNRKLDEETHDFLMRFSQTRRMARNVDPKYGVEGEFYAESTNNWGQDREDNIINYNTPPSTQPGLWCKWTPTEDGMAIEWNGAEKFYGSVEWIQYIITNFLAPKDYVLNGISNAQGEDEDDTWHIVITDNKVEVLDGHAELPQEKTMFMGVDSTTEEHPFDVGSYVADSEGEPLGLILAKEGHLFMLMVVDRDATLKSFKTESFFPGELREMSGKEQEAFAATFHLHGPLSVPKGNTNIRKMSIGLDSTLENWINMTSMFFGEESPATKFLQDKVAKSPNGLQEEVIADERQLIMTLHMMNIQGAK